MASKKCLGHFLLDQAVPETQSPVHRAPDDYQLVMALSPPVTDKGPQPCDGTADHIVKTGMPDPQSSVKSPSH